MKRFTADYMRELLEGISETNFQQWRHHPVTRLYMHYLRDYERQLAEAQIGKLRSSSSSPDQFTLGTFTGAINAVNEMADPKYESIVAFYQSEEQEDDSA